MRHWRKRPRTQKRILSSSCSYHRHCHRRVHNIVAIVFCSVAILDQVCVLVPSVAAATVFSIGRHGQHGMERKNLQHGERRGAPGDNLGRGGHHPVVRLGKQGNVNKLTSRKQCIYFCQKNIHVQNQPIKQTDVQDHRGRREVAGVYDDRRGAQ